jgi:hypothetical protein
VTEPEFLLFASDAELAAYWGAACVLVALACLVMERRRMRRAEINRVGWMPWTGLFLTFAVIGGGLLAMAVPVILGS